MLKLEPRPQASRLWTYGSPVLALAVTVLIGIALFVALGSNHRLTSNSPARFGAMAGGDMGALPYVSDATPGLYGTLWAATTLTTAGSTSAQPAPRRISSQRVSVSCSSAPNVLVARSRLL